MSLETEHRGYKIIYSLNGDVWISYDAGDGMSAPTLSQLKDKIDRLIASTKRQTAVPFYLLVSSGVGSAVPHEFIDASATGYAGPETKVRDYRHEIVGHKIEAVYVGRKWGKPESKAARRVIPLSSCCPVTPEAEAALAEANRLAGLVRDAQSKHQAALQAIPRMTLDDFEALVKLSGIDPSGEAGEKA